MYRLWISNQYRNKWKGNKMAFEDGKKLKIFTGNANPELAKEICDYLGLPLGEAFVGRFNNGEVQIMIKRLSGIVKDSTVGFCHDLF